MNPAYLLIWLVGMTEIVSPNSTAFWVDWITNWSGLRPKPISSPTSKGTFVPNRSVNESAYLTQEVLRSMEKGRKAAKAMMLKLDLEKAFDNHAVMEI